MKQTIREEDLDKIVGRFIIQIDTETPIRLTDRKIKVDFYLEKRVRFISFGGQGIVSCDLYGNSYTKTNEKFIEMFNEYLGDAKGARYHRLLYADELQVVFDFMLKQNY